VGETSLIVATDGVIELHCAVSGDVLWRTAIGECAGRSELLVTP